MTPLRERMIHDMTLRGFSENTKSSYLNSVIGLARHYRRSQGEIAKIGSISASYHVDGSDERDVDPCRVRD